MKPVCRAIVNHATTLAAAARRDRQGLPAIRSAATAMRYGTGPITPVTATTKAVVSLRGSAAGLGCVGGHTGYYASGGSADASRRGWSVFLARHAANRAPAARSTAESKALAAPSSTLALREER